MSRRKPGISVLIPTQNEEALVAICIRSFLNFGDELIVVDNGSTDHTKEIVCELAVKYRNRIKFFDKPELPDLHQNRRFAYEQSSYQWLMRADSDYVAYNEGKFSILTFREFLLRLENSWRPQAFSVPQSNVVGDFWHTGTPMRPGGYRANPERQHISGPVVEPMVRFYRHHRGFNFIRRGRRETVRFQELFKIRKWPHPLWMHCNIKSDLGYLFRSERTNWRELGDFRRFPTLTSYVKTVINKKYGTTDMNKAATLYMKRHIFPYLQPYDPDKYYPYPRLVREQMSENPIYKIHHSGNRIVRSFCGIRLQTIT